MKGFFLFFSAPRAKGYNLRAMVPWSKCAALSTLGVAPSPWPCALDLFSLPMLVGQYPAFSIYSQYKGF